MTARHARRRPPVGEIVAGLVLIGAGLGIGQWMAPDTPERSYGPLPSALPWLPVGDVPSLRWPDPVRALPAAPEVPQQTVKQTVKRVEVAPAPSRTETAPYRPEGASASSEPRPVPMPQPLPRIVPEAPSDLPRVLCALKTDVRADVGALLKAVRP